MKCCMSAALQRHDDILVRRFWIHGELCKMRDHVERTLILIGDIFLQSEIVKPTINSQINHFCEVHEELASSQILCRLLAKNEQRLKM